MLIRSNSKVLLFDVIWNNKTMGDILFRQFNLNCVLSTPQESTRWPQGWKDLQPQQGDLAHQLVSPVAFFLLLRLVWPHRDSSTLLAVGESARRTHNSEIIESVGRTRYWDDTPLSGQFLSAQRAHIVKRPAHTWIQRPKEHSPSIANSQWLKCPIALSNVRWLGWLSDLLSCKCVRY